MDYHAIADESVINQTVEQLKSRGLEALVVKDGVEALQKIKELIPAGVSVMNGSSVTLEQIGFVDYLKSGTHGWNNLHAAIVAEKDPQAQKQLRQQAIHSDYYLGSVHALTADGQMIIASNTGSQLPHIVYTSPNLILVVGAQKIVPSLDEGMRRLESYVVPLEDKHMLEKYQMHTALNKIVIFKGEAAMNGRNIKVMIVRQALGF